MKRIIITLAAFTAISAHAANPIQYVVKGIANHIISPLCDEASTWNKTYLCYPTPSGKLLLELDPEERKAYLKEAIEWSGVEEQKKRDQKNQFQPRASIKTAPAYPQAAKPTLMNTDYCLFWQQQRDDPRQEQKLKEHCN